MTAHHFILTGGAGFCNAVRRTLVHDMGMWAPHHVTIRKNTSCQTDEYLAHRIGLIPFARTGNGDSIELRVQGRTATTSDVVGPAFRPVQNTIEIMHLHGEQEIDLTIHFDWQQASVHARYAPCAAVGMARVDGCGRHRISFETINDTPPRDLLLSALDHLEKRIDKALLALGNQPTSPPQSMC